MAFSSEDRNSISLVFLVAATFGAVAAALTSGVVKLLVTAALYHMSPLAILISAMAVPPIVSGLYRGADGLITGAGFNEYNRDYGSNIHRIERGVASAGWVSFTAFAASVFYCFFAGDPTLLKWFVKPLGIQL